MTGACLTAAMTQVSWPAGKPLEPTVFAVHSQHIHAELTGWRTAKGLLLREPVQATFTYTPALAKCGPSCCNRLGAC